MSLLRAHIAELPVNNIVSLNESYFRICSEVKIVDDVSILDLSATTGWIIYEDPTNLQHIGQYFVVRCHGFTRLYSCCLSQRKDKRKQRN